MPMIATPPADCPPWWGHLPIWVRELVKHHLLRAGIVLRNPSETTPKG